MGALIPQMFVLMHQQRQLDFENGKTLNRNLAEEEKWRKLTVNTSIPLFLSVCRMRNDLVFYVQKIFINKKNYSASTIKTFPTTFIRKYTLEFRTA